MGKTEFVKFLNDRLKLSIGVDDDLFPTPNDMRIKKFVGKIVGKISCDLYEIIYQEAGRLNIYTHEIRCPSKAFKIFISKEYDFEKEEKLRKELLIYFVNADGGGDHSGFMKSIRPLDFDPALESDYIECFGSNVKTISVMDEFDTLFEDEIEYKKSRKSALDAIGSPHFCFNHNESPDDGEF